MPTSSCIFSYCRCTLLILENLGRCWCLTCMTCLTIWKRYHFRWVYSLQVQIQMIVINDQSYQIVFYMTSQGSYKCYRIVSRIWWMNVNPGLTCFDSSEWGWIIYLAPVQNYSSPFIPIHLHLSTFIKRVDLVKTYKNICFCPMDSGPMVLHFAYR